MLQPQECGCLFLCYFVSKSRYCCWTNFKIFSTHMKISAAPNPAYATPKQATTLYFQQISRLFFLPWFKESLSSEYGIYMLERGELAFISHFNKCCIFWPLYFSQQLYGMATLPLNWQLTWIWTSETFQVPHLVWWLRTKFEPKSYIPASASFSQHRILSLLYFIKPLLSNSTQPSTLTS